MGPGTGADQVSASERAFIIRELHLCSFHGVLRILLNSTDPFSHGESASMIAFEVRLLSTRQLTLSLRFSSVAAVCVRITATLARHSEWAKVRWMTGTQFLPGPSEPLARELGFSLKSIALGAGSDGFLEVPPCRSLETTRWRWVTSCEDFRSRVFSCLARY